MTKKQEEAIKELLIQALFTDGAHHKQKFIEEALKEMGVDLEELEEQEDEWEEDIAP